MQAPLFSDFSDSSDPSSPAHDPVVVRLALPVPIDSVFDYVAPEEMAEHARPGHRALVPFSGRRLTGVIVERLEAGAIETPEGRRLSRIDRVVDEEPVVSPAMIGLLCEAARDLLCPVGLALNHALPPGSSPRVAHQLQLTELGAAALAGGAASAAARTVLEVLLAGPVTPAALARGRPGCIWPSSTGSSVGPRLAGKFWRRLASSARTM